jgi:hypothetical protein
MPYHSTWVDSWVVVQTVLELLAEPCHVTALEASEIEETVTDELDLKVVITRTM